MYEVKPLSICNLDEVVALYRRKVDEDASRDPHVGRAGVDERAIRNLLQYRFDIENDVFLVSFQRERAVGFVDSVRAPGDGIEASWYVKAAYLDPECRDEGHFESLVRVLEREVRRRGVGTVYANRSADESADALWEGAGYEAEDDRLVKSLR